MERVRTLKIESSGDLVLSSDLLSRYGLKPGDEISLIETDAGILVASQGDVVDTLLDDLSDAMAKKGLTLEVMLARSDENRAALLKELYDLSE